jgi:hypothetical protein
LGRPQAELPQAPAPQPPEGMPQASRPAEEDDEATAKVDSCFSTESLAQAGQETASPHRFTSFSNLDEQPWQTYS